MIGWSVSQYEITSALGAGGMGEVFRARDTRLKRDVAIKVLPKAFAADPDRLRRFEQESQTLAALNHPNILTIHDTGLHDGAPYLVSELLEGQTLREVLSGGKGAGLPVRKATEYALQIAHGLAAAHGKGIIHRDLKPENVFLTNDGRVKILDFGLAKLQESNRGSAISNIKSADASAPTLLRSTEPGLVLGTPAYMSPEQVRGQPADHRSDIFAFGCVLYEMLRGQRTFGRDTPVESMNAVLTEEPADLEPANASIPPLLCRVVLRCLEKQAENRFQSVKDLAFAIQNAAMSSTVSTSAIAGNVNARRWRVSAVVPWTIAGVCFASLVASVLLHKNTPSPGATAAKVLRKFDLTLPMPGGSSPQEIPLAISPDGKKLVYVNTDGLWMRRLDSITPSVLLAPGNHITAPFWSPESTEVGYFQGHFLYRISSNGGTPSLIATMSQDAWAALPGGAWQGDRVVFTTGGSGLLGVSALGGNVATVLPTGDGEQDFHQASALPDGRGVLFVVHRAPGPDTIAVWSPNRGRKILLQVPGGSLRTPTYSPTGHVLFQRWDQGRGLWAFPFSLEKLERTNEIFRASDTGSAPSVSRDGTLLISLRDSDLFEPRQLVWVDRSGKLEGTIGPPMPGLHGPSLSPDTQHVIAVAGESLAAREIWLLDVGGGNPVPLTRNDQLDDRPSWWNNGSMAVFNRRGESGWEVLAKPADSSRAEQPMIRGEGAHLSRSGKYMILRQRTASGKATVGYVHMAEAPLKFVAFPETFQNIQDYELSPDDRHLAYETEELDANQLYLVDFPGFTNRCAVSRTVAHEMKWHPDGTELFYFKPDAHALMSAKLKPDGSGTQPPVKVFDMPESISPWPADFDVTPDGTRFLMLQRVEEPSSGPSAMPNVRVVLNWFEQFRQPK